MSLGSLGGVVECEIIARLKVKIGRCFPGDEPGPEIAFRRLVWMYLWGRGPDWPGRIPHSQRKIAGKERLKENKLRNEPMRW